MTDDVEILRLIRNCLDALTQNNQNLSSIIRSCIRIARLRNDYISLIWLQREIIDNSIDGERTRALGEARDHLSLAMFNAKNKEYLDIWMKERPAFVVDENGGVSYPKGKFLLKSIPEIETDIETCETTIEQSKTPTGLNPIDTYKIDHQNYRNVLISQVYIKHYRVILENIKNRVFDFLSSAEKQIIFGQYHADFFEQNRRYVELRLGQICPTALQEFNAAVNNKPSTAETRAQILVSIRRLFSDLADILYPPSDNSVIGSDGKSRLLTKEQYINRLWQFVTTELSKEKSGDLLKSAIQDLGNRLDYLYELVNKGIHSEVSNFEFNQCIIQTFIIIGDLIRLFDKKSAMLSSNIEET